MDKPLKEKHLETAAEEAASTFTHALGGLLASAGLTLLVVFASSAHDPRRVVSVSIYGTTLLLMYIASACYHSVRLPGVKRVLQLLDHTSIYLLIAGTYTPILLVSIRGEWGWSLFGVIWGLAGTGVILRIIAGERFDALRIALYIAMGWLVLLAAKPLFTALPLGAICWLVSGGVAYTTGVIFFLWDRLPFNHAIWHLFVMAGSVCHFFAVLLYVLPVARTTPG